MIRLPLAGSNRSYDLQPSKIIAIGLNYREHVKESGAFENKVLDIPTEPVLFAKTPNVLIGPGHPIVIPAIVKSYAFPVPRVDHEAELAVIIGRKCKNVDIEDALSYVFGYTCFNDVSQRNIQKSDASGWFRGKSFDTFGPVGPVVVPAELFGDPQAKGIRCRVNGVLKQEGSTADMIFPVKQLISFVSRNVSLEAGDLIITGTPPGISPIMHGDVVEVEIDGIGVLRNPVREEGRQ